MFNGFVSFGNGNFYSYSQINTNAVAFETANGESVVTYYYPYCHNVNTNSKGYFETQPQMCVNFVYDLNGKKSPNEVGKDIGIITAFYPTDPIIVAANPINYIPKVVLDANNYSNRYSAACRERIDKFSRVATLEEYMSIFVNKNFMPTDVVEFVTKQGSKYAQLRMYDGQYRIFSTMPWEQIICVKE